MIKNVSSDWKSNFMKFDNELRFYIDPRGLEYPPISGTAAYGTSTQNVPGEFLLSSAMTYLWDYVASFTFDVLLQPAHKAGTTTEIVSIEGGDTLKLQWNSAGYYELTDGTVSVTGGSLSTEVKRIGFSFTYGGSMKLYINGSLVDSDTSVALTTKPTKLVINGDAGNLISFVRIFPSYVATATDFSDNFKDVAYEEIFFKFDKTCYGRTRCNINTTGNHVVTSFSLDKKSGYKAAQLSLSLNNLAGQFSDDQYAAYEPQSQSYNGTVDQKYLTEQVGVEVETWGPNDGALYPDTALYPFNSLYPYGSVNYYEPIFKGKTETGAFNRSTRPGALSSLQITANDMIADLAKRVVRKTRNWAGYYLSRATPINNSVFHEIAWLGTKREVYNYLTNSSFENTTIANSWDTTGTFVRDTTQVIAGTYCGKFSGTDQNISQEVDFTDLSADELFTTSFYIYSLSAITGDLTLSESTGGTTHSSTTLSWTHSGLGWDKIVCPHVITDSTSNRLKVTLLFNGTVTNVPIDCAMLTYGEEKHWFVLNSNDGTSGLSSIGSEMSEDYEIIPIDADNVAYIHPWAWIEEGEKVWDNLKEIADAVLARKFYIDSSGILRLRSAFTSALPASSGTIDHVKAVATMQQPLTANKLKVQGAQIEIRPNIQTVWQAVAAGLAVDSGTRGNVFKRTIANGGTFPDQTIDGAAEYEATYGEVFEENK